MAAKRLKSISDLTWQDALIIELKSMLERVESGMTISPVVADRITGMVAEYSRELIESRQATDAAIRDRAKKLAGGR